MGRMRPLRLTHLHRLSLHSEEEGEEEEEEEEKVEEEEEHVTGTRRTSWLHSLALA